MENFIFCAVTLADFALTSCELKGKSLQANFMKANGVTEQSFDRLLRKQKQNSYVGLNLVLASETELNLSKNLRRIWFD